MDGGLRSDHRAILTSYSHLHAEGTEIDDGIGNAYQLLVRAKHWAGNGMQTYLCPNMPYKADGS